MERDNTPVILQVQSEMMTGKFVDPFNVEKGGLREVSWANRTPSQKSMKMDTCLQRVHTTSRHSRFKVSFCLCDTVRTGPVWDTKTTNLAGLHSIEVLATITKEYPTLFMGIPISRGLYQDASQILNLE